MAETQNFNSYEQNHIGYLTLIQGIITRMAGNSALMKGFAATLIAAMFGMAVSEKVAWYYIAVAFLPVIGFIRLDIFYLQLERRYRNLYSLIAEKKITDHGYALDLGNEKFKDYKSEIRKNTGFFKTICSVSVWQFYIWFVAIVIALIIFVA